MEGGKPCPLQLLLLLIFVLAGPALAAPYLKTAKKGDGPISSQQQQPPLDYLFKPSQGLIGPLFRENDYSMHPPTPGGCYYQFRHYDEGDRIITNEPCLNCTCHNSMLMCYLKVCPFSKPIGQDCTVEKSPDQCCPVITCPQVPVNLQVMHMSSTTTLSPTSSSTSMVPFSEHGCTIDGEYYPDGVKVPGNPYEPCELCYCIRNHTTCLMQECVLKVEGCQPVFQEGICCPMRYNCEYDDVKKITTTTMAPNGTLITTTILPPSHTGGCVHNDEFYADGASIESENPCEHCYCMKTDIVCAVQECTSPLAEEVENCKPRTPPPGECCPKSYDCLDAPTTAVEIEVSTITGDIRTDSSTPTTANVTKPSEVDLPDTRTTHPDYEDTDIKATTLPDIIMTEKPTAVEDDMDEHSQDIDTETRKPEDGVMADDVLDMTTELPIRTEDEEIETKKPVYDTPDKTTEKPTVLEEDDTDQNLITKEPAVDVSTMDTTTPVTEVRDEAITEKTIPDYIEDSLSTTKATESVTQISLSPKDETTIKESDITVTTKPFEDTSSKVVTDEGVTISFVDEHDERVTTYITDDETKEATTATAQELPESTTLGTEIADKAEVDEKLAINETDIAIITTPDAVQPTDIIDSHVTKETTEYPSTEPVTSKPEDRISSTEKTSYDEPSTLYPEFEITTDMEIEEKTQHTSLSPPVTHDPYKPEIMDHKLDETTETITSKVTTFSTSTASPVEIETRSSNETDEVKSVDVATESPETVPTTTFDEFVSNDTETTLSYDEFTSRVTSSILTTESTINVTRTAEDIDELITTTVSPDVEVKTTTQKLYTESTDLLEKDTVTTEQTEQTELPLFEVVTKTIEDDLVTSTAEPDFYDKDTLHPEDEFEITQLPETSKSTTDSLVDQVKEIILNATTPSVLIDTEKSVTRTDTLEHTTAVDDIPDKTTEDYDPDKLVTTLIDTTLFDMTTVSPSTTTASEPKKKVSTENITLAFVTDQTTETVSLLPDDIYENETSVPELHIRDDANVTTLVPDDEQEIVTRTSDVDETTEEPEQDLFTSTDKSVEEKMTTYHVPREDETEGSFVTEKDVTDSTLEVKLEKTFDTTIESVTKDDILEKTTKISLLTDDFEDAVTTDKTTFAITDSDSDDIFEPLSTTQQPESVTSDVIDQTTYSVSDIDTTEDTVAITRKEAPAYTKEPSDFDTTTFESKTEATDTVQLYTTSKPEDKTYPVMDEFTTGSIDEKVDETTLLTDELDESVITDSLNTTCIYKEQIYQHGEKIPSSNACDDECSCKNGRVLCTFVKCDLPPPIFLGCNVKFEPTECCPIYECPIKFPPVKPIDEGIPQMTTSTSIDLNITTQTPSDMELTTETYISAIYPRDNQSVSVPEIQNQTIIDIKFEDQEPIYFPDSNFTLVSVLPLTTPAVISNISETTTKSSDADDVFTSSTISYTKTENDTITVSDDIDDETTTEKDKQDEDIVTIKPEAPYRDDVTTTKAEEEKDEVTTSLTDTATETASEKVDIYIDETTTSVPVKPIKETVLPVFKDTEEETTEEPLITVVTTRIEDVEITTLTPEKEVIPENKTDETIKDYADIMIHLPDIFGTDRPSVTKKPEDLPITYTEQDETTKSKTTPDVDVSPELQLTTLKPELTSPSLSISTRSSEDTDMESTTTSTIDDPLTTILYEDDKEPLDPIGDVTVETLGEGLCTSNNILYANGASVPVSSSCQKECRCIDSIVSCKAVICPPPPPDFLKCDAKQSSDECCPSYECPYMFSTEKIESDSMKGKYKDVRSLD